MKVLAINGSPRPGGNTYLMLRAACDALEERGIETEIVCAGDRAIAGCRACGACASTGRCVLGDEWFRTVTGKMVEADGILLGTPVYYAGMNGTMKSFLDRAFFQSGMKAKLRLKVGASVAVCRRAGSVSAFDELNHYFLISEMVVAPSTYWNMGIGRAQGEVSGDAEALSTMARLGRNMAWLLHMKQATAGSLPLPE